jgi:hypothetical protein
MTEEPEKPTERIGDVDGDPHRRYAKIREAADYVDVHEVTIPMADLDADGQHRHWGRS